MTNTNRPYPGRFLHFLSLFDKRAKRNRVAKMAAVVGEGEGGEKVVETTVKLVSSEGHTFIVHKKAAIISQTIKSMIEEGEVSSSLFLLSFFLIPTIS